MTQILDSLPAGHTNGMLCCYSNNDRILKIARITNIPNWYFERVVFPGERLLFAALPKAQLEIYVTNFSTVALVELIECDRLAVKTFQTSLVQPRETVAEETIKSVNLVEKFINKKRVLLAAGSKSRKWQSLLSEKRF